MGFCHSFATVEPILAAVRCRYFSKWFKIEEASNVGA